ncbi:MAG: hypothetical protein OXP68_03635 [Anaerolineaceae bacterium]|nr:hypothetical protein [Anaerolineaceae bacterium]MDE0330172.1 hypothetical protein [Anaerolineaceae bacterium]
MADYFFESREDFHYDNSGYYGYIVFNGDEKTLNGLRNALGQGKQSHGLGWYRYGKSFRPANDGRMYDWYIRLHSGGNDKPAAQAVDDFLRSHLQPPKVTPGPSGHSRRPSAPLTRDLQRLQTDIARERAVHQEAYGAQQRLATLLGSLQGIDTRISDDLEQLRLDLQDIADTWRADNWSDLNLGSIIHALDSVNERLTRDLTRLQRDYSDIASAHADTLRAQDELAQVLERIKDHDRHISDDLARLQQDVQRIAERESSERAGESQEALLTRFDDLEQRMGERISELERAVKTGTAAQASLEEMRTRLEIAEEAQESAEQAQAEAETALDAMQAELAAMQEESPGDQFWHEKYNDSENLNRKLNKDNKTLEKENKRLQRDLRKTAGERDNFSRQFLEASKKIGEMEKNASQELPEPFPLPADRRMKTGDLQNILEGAFPNLVLARDSLDTLHHEIQNYRPVFQRLSQIVNVPEYNGRNSLKGKSKWREDTIGKRWRIYFCKESMPGNKLVVYLGDKNHQNDDIAWLFSNPPETCL